MNLNFASDNTGPIAPAIMDAIVQQGTAAAMPYGNDPTAEAVHEQIRKAFGWPDAETVLVSVGTAANALALATICKPFETVFCHRVAHIEEDECGAPEFYTGGAKLTLVEGADAKMTPDTLRAAIARTGGSVHNVQRGALSITNVTEKGTVYTLDQMRALTDVARAHGLRTHLDGARFANACAALGCTAAELVEGFDIVSFGGTKNGCMGVEAIVTRDPSLRWELELRRKRAGHLWSKHRFLAAQMSAYLTDDLWLELARRSNAAGRRLATGLQRLGATFEAAPDANLMFAMLPRAAHVRALDAGAQYYVMGDMVGAPDEPVLCRFVCDWSKTDEEVDQLLALLGEA